MAHRRKSSHPVCKTRRVELTAQDEDDDDNDVIVTGTSHDRVREDGDHMETEDGDGQQIVLPSDLFRDFEAVRSKTKLDATNLMRKLLKDYQSLASVGGKTLQNEDQTESEVTGSTPISANTSIAKDVSLATTRVDTEDDQYQGLDLSVGTRKISSQLFDTNSLNGETFEQPLDLTCTKTHKDSLNGDSPSSNQLDISSVHNEFNYVYVYPGLYPPASGVMSTDGEGEGQRNDSPLPELLSPSKLVLPESLSRSPYLTPNDTIDSMYGTPNTYKSYSESMGKRSSSSPGKISPLNIKREPVEAVNNNCDVHAQTYQKPIPKGKQGANCSPSSQNKTGKKDNKKSTEMKVISENTTAGVYTSVMKLPWSRRTRTKKPKHKVKLEDTLIPQFMLEKGDTGGEFMDWDVSQGPQNEHENEHCKNTENSESVMMVYPSGGTSAYGKPVRKRGRPPKMPMLAKLLQNQQAGKKSKTDKQTEEMQGQITQQVQASGGMVVYNAEGQIMTAVSGAPVPNVSVMTSEGTPINMAQAQFIGQIPLSQLTGGPIQFLGQFPAGALPFPGHMLQAIPAASVKDQTQVSPCGSTEDAEGETNGDDDKSSTNAESQQPVNFQYAFQPMFIPAGAIQIPMQASPTMIQAGANDVMGDVNDGNNEGKQQDPDEPLKGNTASVLSPSTHVMKIEGTDSVSTMSTTSISNTGSGAIYQEMILSSKSLVDVKKRKRQTAIQMLKSKSGDSNFLCTSFRIRPRLVAQAQAQRERLAAKEVKEEITEDDCENNVPKNVQVPQNDEGHFGENNGLCDIDFSNIQVKQEINSDDEVYENVKEFEQKQNKQIKTKDSNTLNKDKPVIKRFVLKGSQKRKAKFYGSRIVNDSSEIANGSDKGASSDKFKEAQGELFQELFNCKVCNKIISADEMEAHSLEHVNKNYVCQKCGVEYNEGQIGTEEIPKCGTCDVVLLKIDNQFDSSSAIGCDECNETFRSLPEFYEHQTEHNKKHNSKDGFECDFCGKVYQYYHALQFHRRTHRVRKVPCLEKSCDMKFRSRKEMELHFDAKHPDKKEYFHCMYEGCTKKFLKNFHLQEHIRVKHYNIKAFQCPWPGCLKEFAARGHLKIHLLIHRNEKPMKCDHCEYRCRQRSAMNWHMRKHPDVPYKYKRATKSPSASKSESD